MNADPTPTERGKKELSNDIRLAVYHYLLSESNQGKLKHGSFTTAASKFKISTKTASRIWQRGQRSLEEGSGSANVSSCKLGNVGRKKVEIKLFNSMLHTKSHKVT